MCISIHRYPEDPRGSFCISAWTVPVVQQSKDNKDEKAGKESNKDPKGGKPEKVTEKTPKKSHNGKRPEGA